MEYILFFKIGFFKTIIVTTFSWSILKKKFLDYIWV